MRKLFSSGLLLTAAMSLAPLAHAGLIGDVGITWLFPDTSTTFATDTIAVSSTLSCPGTSPICTGYGEGTESFTVNSTSITYTATGDSTYAASSFNGFNFTGLTFADAGTLTGFTLIPGISGLTSSAVSFGPHNIEINLEDLEVAGSFTLNLSETAGSSTTPEPSFLAPLALAFGGFVFFLRRRKATA